MAWYQINVANERHATEITDLEKEVLRLRAMDSRFRLYATRDFYQQSGGDHTYYLRIPDAHQESVKSILDKHAGQACDEPDPRTIRLLL